MLGYLTNLSSREVLRGNPWEFVPKVDLQEWVDKRARTAWSQQTTTDHCFYTGFLGEAELLRIGEENPARTLLAIVADVDTPMSHEVLAAALEQLDPAKRPRYAERTLSGKWRLVLPLTRPFIAGTAPEGFWSELLTKLLKFLNWQNVFPGIDDCFFKPSQTFFNHCEWFQVTDNQLDTAILHGQAREVFEKILSKHSASAARLSDWEGARQALAERYPRFATEWEGLPFGVGAMGSTFWVEDSVSSKSAKVFETGIYTHAEHNGGKAFWSWADLLGPGFLEKDHGARDERIFDTLFYSDSEHRYLFWSDAQALKGNPWVGITEGAAKDYLMQLGVGRAKDKNTGLTEVDRVMIQVRDRNRVAGLAPFMFNPNRIISTGSTSVLNSYPSTRRVLSAAPGIPTWGPKGKFPTLSYWFDTQWASRADFEAFMTYWKQIYMDHLGRVRRVHQVLCMVGPVQVGKTLMNQGAIGRSLGGHCESSAYLTGVTNFTGDMWNYAWQTVDDGEMSHSSIVLAVFDERIKSIASKSSVVEERKFCSRVAGEWFGGVGITANSDATLLTKALPSTTIASHDKIIIVKTSTRRIELPQAEAEKILDAELPYALAWLMQWEPPAHLLSAGRYGMVPWRNPEITQLLAKLDPAYFVTLSLHSWLKNKFKNNGFEEFSCDPNQLWKELREDVDRAYNQRTLIARVEEVISRLQMSDLPPWLERDATNGRFVAKRSRLPDSV